MVRRYWLCCAVPLCGALPACRALPATPRCQPRPLPQLSQSNVLMVASYNHPMKHHPHRRRYRHR